MNQQKKLILLLLIMICLLMLFLSKDNTNNKKDNNALESLDLKTPVLIKNSSNQMPPMSSHDYIVEEYKILNSVMSEGMVISEYKRIFTNSQRLNYDIESAYKDFDNDFNSYSVHLKESISQIQSLNPKLNDAQSEQSDTLLKLTKLYSKINDYNNHDKSLKDTLNYLNECKYELNRLNNQAKLPN